MPTTVCSRFVSGKLLAEGRIRRARIGVAGQNVPLPRRLVRFHDLELETGILVAGLEPDSPGYAAGLVEGDVIIGFAGAPVAGIDDLHRLLTEERVGMRTGLTILRGAERRELSVVPGLLLEVGE